MNKYLKRKYRELKMYVKNGWWGYSKLVAAPGQAGGVQPREDRWGCQTVSRRSMPLPIRASLCTTFRSACCNVVIYLAKE